MSPAIAIGGIALFCLLLWGLATLADYLENQEQAIRNRYDEPPLGVESADPDSTVPGWRRG